MDLNLNSVEAQLIFDTHSFNINRIFQLKTGFPAQFLIERRGIPKQKLVCFVYTVVKTERKRRISEERKGYFIERGEHLKKEKDLLILKHVFFFTVK